MERDHASQSGRMAVNKIAIAFPLLLVWIACRKPSVDIYGERVDTVVVYSLLDPADTVNYAVIYRAVLSEGSATEQLSKPELLYPSGWTVRVSWAGGTLSFYPETLPLPLFNSPFRVVYRTAGFLPELTPVTLEILDESGQLVASAQIVTLEKIRAIYPSPYDTITPLEFYPGENLQLIWERVQGAHAYAIQLGLIYERESGAGTWIKDTEYVDVAPFYVPPAGTYSLQLSYSADEFYQSLSVRLDTTTTKRVLGMITVFWAASKELYDYARSYSAQLYSLAGTELLPVWTNVKGGLGVVASRTRTYVGPHRLSSKSIDSLACNEITRSLRFLTSGNQLCRRK